MSSSATERLDDTLAKIAAEDPTLNLVTNVDEHGARAAAQATDARSNAGKTLGPLDGMIVGIKDNIAVQGLPWTAGLAGWRDRIAETDAEVVARLRAAGAVILGTLNMHEAAFGATSDNPTYGRAANPLDPTRTPGGSSGGSAGAVAAGFVEAALGTDTLGSVRLPSAYCGLVGLKPTNDAISDAGLTFLCPSLDTVGPMARDAATVAALFTAIRDPLPGRDTGLPDWDHLTVGVPAEVAMVKTEPAVSAAFDRARAAVASRGAQVVEVSLEGWDPARTRRGALLIVEAEAAVELADIRDTPDGMTETLRDLLEYGAALSSARLVEALARTREARRAARRALNKVNVLMMPTVAERAFRHTDPVPDNQAAFTTLANVAGLPAISVPVACDEGLPAAVQFLGPDWSDRALLGLAEALPNL